MMYRKILTREARENLIDMYCYYNACWREAIRENVFHTFDGKTLFSVETKKADALAAISELLDEHDAAVAEVRREWALELLEEDAGE